MDIYKIFIYTVDEKINVKGSFFSSKINIRLMIFKLKKDSFRNINSFECLLDCLKIVSIGGYFSALFNHAAILVLRQLIKKKVFLNAQVQYVLLSPVDKYRN